MIGPSGNQSTTRTIFTPNLDIVFESVNRYAYFGTRVSTFGLKNKARFWGSSWNM